MMTRNEAVMAAVRESVSEGGSFGAKDVVGACRELRGASPMEVPYVADSHIPACLGTLAGQGRLERIPNTYRYILPEREDEAARRERFLREAPVVYAGVGEPRPKEQPIGVQDRDRKDKHSKSNPS